MKSIIGGIKMPKETEDKKEDKKEKKDDGDWAVGEVPETMKDVIYNKKTEEVLDVKLALSKILNNQEKMIKALL